MGRNIASKTTGGAKTDVDTNPAAILSALPNRVFVEIQNQSDVTMRLGVGEAASTTNGVKIAPGATYYTERFAASSFSLCTESGSSKTAYIMPASEV